MDLDDAWKNMIADIGNQPGNKDDNRYSSAMIVEESKKALTPLKVSVWELACVAKKGKWALPSCNGKQRHAMGQIQTQSPTQ